MSQQHRAVPDEPGFRFSDPLGPRQITFIDRPDAGLRAIVVVDNTAAGPAIGGVRLASDVSLEECVRLARAMTLKNAAAGLPHGGGKSVIFGDSRMSAASKEGLIRSFAREIEHIVDYIPGPDMGTDERCMAWVHDEIGRCVGLPAVLGGIPLDQIGATGLGVAIAAQAAEQFSRVRVAGARVAIQGFGAVGKHAARFLEEGGAVIVAASDSSGTLLCPEGIDVPRLTAIKDRGGAVHEYTEGTQLPVDAIVEVECDIWIPAARPDVLHRGNVERLRARLVVQGANIPATEEAERLLHERGVVSIPDFIANAGGVICAATEYHGGSEADALDSIRSKIGANTIAVLERSLAEGVPPREAAVAMARSRVTEAMELRRHF